MSDPREVLKKYWGYTSFKYPQEEIIGEVLSGKDVLAVLPTGFGKSVIYQVAGLCTGGVTVVISPLVSLMEDQVQNLRKIGILAEAVTGKLSGEQLRMKLDNVRYGKYPFLFLSPERLQNRTVQDYLSELPVRLITIDEAHCVSEWGHDFRPDYLRIKDLRKLLPGVPVLALTATAQPQTRADIIRKLEMQNPVVFKMPVRRENLAFSVIKSEDKFGLVSTLLQDNTSAIVYVNTRRNTVFLAQYLQNHQIAADFFHGGLTQKEKKEKLEKWKNNEVPVMVATSAFGMGIDKPDVRKVIHFNIPWSLENYMQEAGRAGRDGKGSKAILIYHKEDVEMFQRLLELQLPSFELIKEVLTRLYSSFFIAYGEGAGVTVEADMREWARKRGYKVYQIGIILRILESTGMIMLLNETDRRPVVQVTETPERVREFIQDKTYDDHPLQKVLSALVKAYPDILEQPKRIDVKPLMKYLDINEEKLNKHLEKLHQYGWIEYKKYKGQTQIKFLRNRDDSAINMYAKEIRKFLENKREKALKVLEYVRNEQICRQRFLAEYFGENEVPDCGKCDVCLCRQTDEEQLEKEVLDVIQMHKGIALYHLKVRVTCPGLVEKIIRKLLEKKMIVERKGGFYIAG